MTILPSLPPLYADTDPTLSATVTDPSDVLSGGTLRVNDITIVIPRNLLVTLPSITVSWAELFTTDGTLNLPNLSYGWEVSVRPTIPIHLVLILTLHICR